MKQVPTLFAFNRGIVSEFALGRSDQPRLALSAEIMDNFIPRVIGPMVFRPGLGYIGASASNNAARFLKFIFSTSDTAKLELTNLLMRVWINDTLLTRPTATSTVTNGTFTGNITGWTDGSDAGGTADYEATDHLRLVSNDTARAIAYQLVTTASATIEHALRIVIDTGPVTLRVGSSLGGDEYVTETDLDTGTHSISFTPTGSYYVQFASTSKQKKLVDNCTVEAAGVVTLPTPWTAASLGKVRYDQSGDILFVACDGFSQRKIERRGTRPNARSWSVVTYQTDDGPFLVENTGPITMAASATTGNITVTASAPYFRSGHVGGLFSITSFGQAATATIAAQNTFTGSVLVAGLTRSFGITITGDLSAGSTVTLQSSTDNVTFSDVSGQTWATALMPVSTAYDDTLLNQQIYYRIGIKTGEYSAADSVVCTLIYNAGSQRGIVRITAVATSLSASAEVILELGGIAASDIWQEGQWSSFRGYPTSVRIHEGRLWWFGRNWILGSVSDDYVSFNETVLGSSGPISRTLGSGPVDIINWALSLQRLIIGAEGREISARSSDFDTPLTPIDFNLKDASTQGSAAVEAYELDQRGIFVHRNGVKLYEISVANKDSRDYMSADLMEICPELAAAGIVRVDIQRQPDTRIHCVLADGTALIAVYSTVEKILSWQTVTTDGLIEDLIIMPAALNSLEDRVYYLVNRTINGSTVRYLEKWAKETECRGGTTSKNMDSFISVTNSPASVTVTVGSTLEAESVVVWADGAPLLDSNNDPQTFTVSASPYTITLPTAATNIIIGLAYTGQWQSTKLGTSLSEIQTLLGSHKQIGHISFILAYFSRAGFTFGPDFSHLDDMPGVEGGTTAASFSTAYDEEMILFPATWTSDLRLCLQAKSPMPLTVMAVAMEIEIT